jgi:hypothetical protein
MLLNAAGGSCSALCRRWLLLCYYAADGSVLLLRRRWLCSATMPQMALLCYSTRLPAPAFCRRWLLLRCSSLLLRCSWLYSAAPALLSARLKVSAGSNCPTIGVGLLKNFWLLLTVNGAFAKGAGALPPGLTFTLPSWRLHRREAASHPLQKYRNLGSKSPCYAFHDQADRCLTHFHRPTMEPDIFILYEKSLVEVNQAILAWSSWAMANSQGSIPVPIFHFIPPW